MRKNKKLFAILTLVAFMMTLMPVLAFAGTPTGEVAVSSLTVTGQNKITLTAADKDHIGIYATDGTNYTSTTPAKPIVTASGAGSIEIDASGLAAGGHWAIVKVNDADPTVAVGDTVTNTADFTTENLAKAYYNGKALTGEISYDADGKVTITCDTNADLYTANASSNFAAVTQITGAGATTNKKSFTTDAAGVNGDKFILVPTGTVADIAGTAMTGTTLAVGSNDTSKILTVDGAVVTAITAWKNYKAGATSTTISAVTSAFNSLSTSQADAFYEATNASETEVNTVIDAQNAVDKYDAYAADPTSATKYTRFKETYEKTTPELFNILAGATKSALAEKVYQSEDVFAGAVILEGSGDLSAAVTAWGTYYATPSTANWNAFKTAAAKVSAADLAAALGNKATLAQNVLNAADSAAAARLVAADKAGGGSVSAGNASVDASIIATVDANASIESHGTIRQDGNNGLEYSTDKGKTWNGVPDTKYEELDLVFKAANGGNTSPSTIPSGFVYVWAEENGKSGQASDAFVLNKGDKTTWASGSNVYRIATNTLNAGSNTLRAAFVRPGTFTIKASFVDPRKGGGAANAIDGNAAVLKNVTNKTTITATAVAQETRKFYINVAQGPSGNTRTVVTGMTDGQKSTDKGGKVSVAADTVATTRVVLTVFNGEGNPMSTYPVRLSTNSANIELDETSVTTDYNAQATFNVAGIREGEYKIYVTIGDYESTIVVQVGATAASDIQLIKFPSNPIATDTLETDYKDVFRFQLTDANGNIVNNGYNGATYAAMKASESEKRMAEQAKYAYIVSAPEANKVKDADLMLEKVPGKDYYTLSVDSNKAFTAEGDYEIRVVLNNGKSATLNFTVKKFDKAVSLHIEYPTTAVELNSLTEKPDIYFLDASNVMKKANNRVTVAAQGYAVASVVENGDNAGVLKIKNDEKYVGQTITVTAASDKENLMASTTLTVADEAREVKLDTNRGPVNANNRVGFKVVDSTGAPVALGNEAGTTVEVTAVVTNTGDPDAKVSYSVTSSSRADLKEKGTGIINLSANKQTTATVQIMVKVTKAQTSGSSTQAGDNNTGLSTTYYSGTETFTFGAEADKSVVMTIGSKEIVAQNVPVTIDVAPFIQDNRTYVPFRALVEAFGAEVDYNADNNTVTTKLDGKTVVLTVGSTVLTVNDETVTMDVAPFIVDDRVVVPVRFVGEAFGFTVEATQDADTGATASVVFYQK